MRYKNILLLGLSLFSLLNVGCATKSSPEMNYGQAELVEFIAPQKTLEIGEVVTNVASVALGTPYKRGAMSLNNGFDCSGLVKWTFSHFGVEMPRTAREQSKFGEIVPKTELKEGDVVNFYSKSRGYHSGIYVGGNKFIHSPNKKDVVKITSLDSDYFRQYFIGARRVIPEKEFDLDKIEEEVNRLKKDKLIANSVKITTDSQKKIANAKAKPQAKPKAKAKTSTKTNAKTNAKK